MEKTIKPAQEPQTINGEQVFVDSSEWWLSAEFAEHFVPVSLQHLSSAQQGVDESEIVSAIIR